jgi:3-hydroxybutyryl-CoA dehydrogenase
MNYADKLKNVTVLGAAGKMGSGILLLTAIEMTDLSLKPENKDKTFVLNALDISHSGLKGLMQYLRVQVRKLAEKKIVLLRELYADQKELSENGEIIDQYIFDVLNTVRPVTTIESAYESTLIFEAASENSDLKIKLFTQIDQNNPNKPLFFTNTSSIPIKYLEEKASLKGRVLGFHFYNPPAVQKLVELIVTANTLPEVNEFALQYAKNLKKIIVPSNDYAGFIGNGHFMRDALHAIQEVERLADNYGFVEAVYMLDTVSRDFLVRPMGIFQLVDYVGVDVVKFIMNVMNPYLPNEELNSSLLDKYFEMGVKGGQNSNGSQKDGFIKYEKGKLVAIFNPTENKYVAIDSIKVKCDEILGKLPASYKPWKAVVGRKVNDTHFNPYFAELKDMNNLGAELAKTYHKRSIEIGKLLVNSGVANKDEDVNKVMLTGFFHAYGPINSYLQ